jgi:hypothetical protein
MFFVFRKCILNFFFPDIDVDMYNSLMDWFGYGASAINSATDFLCDAGCLRPGFGVRPRPFNPGLKSA